MTSVVKSSLRWTAALMLLSIAGTATVLIRAHRDEERKHYLGFTRMIATLVHPSLSISDYGEVQRLLALVPAEAGVVPAVLTREGDLLMADYSMRPLFGNVLADAGSPGPQGYEIFQAKIIDRKDLASTPEELGSVIALHANGLASFSWIEIGGLLAALAAALFGVGLLIQAKIRARYLKPIETLAARLEEESAIDAAQLPTELKQLSRAFLKLLDGSRIELKNRQEQEKKKALHHLAQQIAQDLKLPLSALESNTADPHTLEKAFRRLKDVDQQLLEKQLELQ
jgi:hypothetical protein